MRTYDYKIFLKNQRLNINQVEDFLNFELEKIDEVFDYSTKEILNYKKSYKSWKKDLQKQQKKFDHALDNLNKEIEKIKTNINDSDFIIDENSLNNQVEAVGKSYGSLWTEENKKVFTSLHDQYYSLTVKNDIRVRVSKVFSKNFGLKIIIKISLFSFSFLSSFWISWKLEHIESQFGKLLGALVISCLTYITLDQLVNFAEKEFQFWRVKKLHYSYLLIIPIYEKAKDFLK
jgi:hypothetical protein